MQVRVRGVYATALTKLLLDSGIRVSHTSKKIRERFSLDETREPPNVTIKDTDDKHGVVIVGEREDGERVFRVLSEKLDCVCWVSKLPLHSIIKGRVVEVNEAGSVIDLGRYKGVIEKRLETGSEVLVDVARPFMPNDKFAKLSDRYTVYGRYVALIRGLGRKVLFSKHIISKRLREDLTSLAGMVDTGEWSVKWRSSAVIGEIGEMIRDLQETLSKAEEIMKKAEEADVGEIISGGEFFAIVSFTKEGKALLDEIRDSVLPTIPGHHSLKSMNESEVVEFAEHMLNRGFGGKESLSEVVFDYVKNLMREGLVSIQHISVLSGDVKNLTPGKVVDSDGEVVTMKRIFRGRGFLDGLGVKKSPGDYDLMEFSTELPLILHKYYGRDGSFKGLYVNVNTPPEVSRNSIRYLDMEVDVVANGESVRIIDSEHLEKAFELGIVDAKTRDLYLGIAEEVKDRISSFGDIREISLLDIAKK